MNLATRALTFVLCSALVGCGNSEATGDDRICSNAPDIPVQGDWAGCIHRWSYRLAGSPDPARDVADAVVAACGDAIAWQINAAAEPEREGLASAIMDSAPKEALFRVVQARAGNCGFP